MAAMVVMARVPAPDLAEFGRQRDLITFDVREFRRHRPGRLATPVTEKDPLTQGDELRKRTCVVGDKRG
jgi:hypothetical protein